MNRDNLLKLRAALEVLPPERFDYRLTDRNCGCVVPVMKEVFDYDEDIALNLTTAEMDYLTGFEDLRPVEPRDRQAHHFHSMTDAEATGAAGIAEAIRRIDVLLAREEENHDA